MNTNEIYNRRKYPEIGEIMDYLNDGGCYERDEEIAKKAGISQSWIHKLRCGNLPGEPGFIRIKKLHALAKRSRKK